MGESLWTAVSPIHMNTQPPVLVDGSVPAPLFDNCSHALHVKCCFVFEPKEVLDRTHVSDTIQTLGGRLEYLSPTSASARDKTAAITSSPVLTFGAGLSSRA